MVFLILLKDYKGWRAEFFLLFLNIFFTYFSKKLKYFDGCLRVHAYCLKQTSITSNRYIDIQIYWRIIIYQSLILNRHTEITFYVDTIYWSNAPHTMVHKCSTHWVHKCSTHQVHKCSTRQVHKCSVGVVYNFFPRIELTQGKKKNDNIFVAFFYENNQAKIQLSEHLDV